MMRWHMLDLASDPRRAQYEYFRTLSNPFVGFTVKLDVAPAVAFSRAVGAPFYTVFIHLAALAANGVPQLRRRVRDGGVVEYDTCGTSHIEALSGGGYGYCTLYHDIGWEKYLPDAARRREASRSQGSIEEDADVEGLYFITAIPWLHYEQFVQPTDARETNPRISWGRYEPDGAGRLMMPVTLVAHHGLADGEHLAQFYENLTSEIHRLGED